MTLPTFAQVRAAHEPFPHMRIEGILTDEHAGAALAWLRDHAPWNLRIEDFYEQHEFSLLNTELGEAVATLAAPAFVEAVRHEMQDRFSVLGALQLVDVTAHRLTCGQTIRIHNDFLEGEETHRLLIQLNDGWDVGRGGLLMLFAGSTPETLRHVVMPTHASGFAFEISPTSFHAVSSVVSGERFTVVYTFRPAGP